MTRPLSPLPDPAIAPGTLRKKIPIERSLYRLARQRMAQPGGGYGSFSEYVRSLIRADLKANPLPLEKRWGTT